MGSINSNQMAENIQSYRTLWIFSNRDDVYSALELFCFMVPFTFLHQSASQSLYKQSSIRFVRALCYSFLTFCHLILFLAHCHSIIFCRCVLINYYHHLNKLIVSKGFRIFAQQYGSRSKSLCNWCWHDQGTQKFKCLQIIN